MKGLKILLSINPKFVEKIFAGTKKFEYRKTIFKDTSVQSIVVYATRPIGKVIGEFRIKSIIEDNPSIIWKKTKQYSGVSREFYSSYFYGRNKGFAIEIGELTQYAQPIELNDLNVSHAPQSFLYLPE